MASRITEAMAPSFAGSIGKAADNTPDALTVGLRQAQAEIAKGHTDTFFVGSKAHVASETPTSVMHLGDGNKSIQVSIDPAIDDPGITRIIQEWWDGLSDGYQQGLLSSGIKYDVTHHIDALHPGSNTGISYPGHYNPETNVATIATHEKYWSFLTDQHEMQPHSYDVIQQYLTHESGHGLHRRIAGSGLPVPKEIQEAHARDVAKLTDEKRKAYAYYIQGADSGNDYTQGVTTRSGQLEVIAESLASSQEKFRQHPDFLSDFPETTALALKNYLP